MQAENPAHLDEQTPATVAIAAIFMLCVAYFIAEQFFLASEYYLDAPPYALIGVSALLAGVLVLTVLRQREPQRENSAQFVMLMALGVGLASYAVIPRLNIVTDSNGLVSHRYTLGNDYVWTADDGTSPAIDMYMDSSAWWRQFQPGDSYTFKLRQGGLGIWQISMVDIYRQQQAFYDCDGVLSCMRK